MTKPFDEYLGRNRILYAGDVIRALDIKHPPIREERIAEFLGYEIKEVSAEETSQWPGIREIFKIAFAHLFKKENVILLNCEVMRFRRRLGAFHEFGHDLLPWHTGLNFACSDTDINPIFHQRIENEAFVCGSEIMMPGRLFIPDGLSLPLRCDSIKRLASRYDASVEATAIRYARTNPKICGVVMIEPTDEEKPLVAAKTDPPGQLLLPFRFSRTPVTDEGKSYPLRVKYSVRSHRFLKYIRPGTGIGEDTTIFEAWASGQSFENEIPASVFGSSARWAYKADCIPFGTGVLVLLWIPDRQFTLNLEGIDL